MVRVLNDRLSRQVLIFGKAHMQMPSNADTQTATPSHPQRTLAHTQNAGKTHSIYRAGLPGCQS